MLQTGLGPALKDEAAQSNSDEGGARDNSHGDSDGRRGGGRRERGESRAGARERGSYGSAHFLGKMVVLELVR